MPDEIKSSEVSLIKFPCDFTIKVVGKGTDEFDAAVLMIIHQHVPKFSDRAIETKTSKKGNYRSLSITVPVESKAQLDAIYEALSASPEVLMAL